MATRFVTHTVQGSPDLWLGHHSARIVCQLHADAEQIEFWEPLTAAEIFDFEFDMGQRISTIAECATRHIAS